MTAWSCSAPRPTKRTLQFVGDSITFQSTADITAHYAPKYSVSVWGLTGIDTWFAAKEVSTVAAKPPDIVVINIGTNDARRMPIVPPGRKDEPTGTLDGTLARLAAMRAEFPTSTCVVFVTIDEKNPSWGPTNAARINALVRTFPHVADWATALAPGDFDGPDNPHPNEVGRQHLLAVEDAAIAGCPSV